MIPGLEKNASKRLRDGRRSNTYTRMRPKFKLELESMPAFQGAFVPTVPIWVRTAVIEDGDPGYLWISD